MVEVENFRTPAVTIVNRGFVNDARSAASGKGYPNFRVVAENVFCESNDEKNIDEGITAVMDEIIAALTKPLTPEEKNPRKETQNLSRIVFKGNLQDTNRFFYQLGWSDGLPIIPPTEEAVAEMMTGTDLAPDHVVTKVIPRMGKATVEKIAINAVMAGALPTYMPVLIAAIQSLVDRRTRFDIYEVSTGSWAPFVGINGKIRNDINLNCSSGALSPGNIANSAIGRALGLIIKNIGGVRKGVEDMGVIGNPGKYSLVIGENEEECAWEPHNIQRGYKKGDNSVTTFVPNTFNQMIPHDTNAKGILDMILGMGLGGLSCVILIPTYAKMLANEGWTRQKTVEYLAKNAKLPFANPNAKRPGLDPNDIMIMVAGGPGAFSAVLRGAGGSTMQMGDFVDKKIETPKNWDKLVSKYKNIIPTYFRY